MDGVFATSATIGWMEPLKQVPNLILTPHFAWTSRQARQRLVDTLASHLQDYRLGKSPLEPKG